MRAPLGVIAGALAILPWLGGTSAAEPRDEGATAGFTKGLLFEITTEGVAPSYLFATIHSDDPRVLALPAPVRAAFDGTSVFVMEAIPDAEAIRKATALTRFSSGEKLRDVLPAKLYDMTVAAVASRGLSADAIQDTKPWALVTLLSAPAPSGGGGEVLDLYLYRTALAQGKPAVGLETLDEQASLFDQLSEADQVALLQQTLAVYPELRLVFQRLVAAYLRRDLSALVQLSDMYDKWGSAELAERFHRIAIDERNQRMAERLVPMLSEGGRFIAVGALHLPGSGGLLERLVDQGYQVRAIY